MSKNRSRLIKLLILGVLLFALYFSKDFLSSLMQPEPSQPFAPLQKNSVSDILIKNDKKEYQLFRKNDRWFTKKDSQQYPADDEKINQILANLYAVKKEDVVSSNKEKHQNFGIGKKSILFKSAGKTYTFYVGDSSGLSKNYVRIDDENDVFIASGFDTVFSTEDYRDLSIHLIDKTESVTSIQIYSEGKTITLEKKNNDWVIGGKKAKKDRVDFYLNDLATLKAKDILQKQENYPDVNPEISIIINESNKEKSVGFYLQDEENYFARVIPSDFDYIVASGYVASLKKEEKDFTD